MTLRLWIVRALWSGGASLGIGIISSVLSLVLGSLGDRTGADAVRGVTLVAFAVFVLALISLVVILAVNELRQAASTCQPMRDAEDSLD